MDETTQTKQPNESGSVEIMSFIRIKDPDSEEVILEKRGEE